MRGKKYRLSGSPVQFIRSWITVFKAFLEDYFPKAWKLTEISLNCTQSQSLVYILCLLQRSYRDSCYLAAILLPCSVRFPRSSPSLAAPPQPLPRSPSAAPPQPLAAPPSQPLAALRSQAGAAFSLGATLVAAVTAESPGGGSPEPCPGVGTTKRQ